MFKTHRSIFALFALLVSLHVHANVDMLFAGAKNGNLKKVNHALRWGVTPDHTRGELRWTPLHFAANGGHADVVERLLFAGANPDARDNDGMTPLHLAVICGDIEIVGLLLRLGANSAIADKDEIKPKQLALQYRRPDLADLIDQFDLREIQHDPTKNQFAPLLWAR